MTFESKAFAAVDQPKNIQSLAEIIDDGIDNQDDDY